MIALRLFCASRRLVGSVVAFAACAAVALWIGSAQLRLREDAATSVPWLVLVPLLPACLVGLGVRSPLHQFDRLAARPMWTVRSLHLAVLAALATVAGVLPAIGLGPPTGAAAALRNLAGFTGLALLGGVVFGSRLSWLLPISWAVSATTLGDPTGTGLPWDWPVRVDADRGALLIALALLVAGCATFLARGSREPAAEVD